jgi:VWFA-related protein
MSRNASRHAFSLVIAATLLSGSIAPAFSQQPPTPKRQDEQDEVVRVNSNLVQVDALVVDDRGRQVPDLQASDFEIVEDGAPRRPEYAQYVSVEGGAAAKPADGRLAANEVRRSTVFVVTNPVIEIKNNFFSDERPFDTQPSSVLLPLAVTNAHAAARVLTRFVDEQMGAHDLAAIRDTEGPPGPFTGLTADRSVLRRAIEHVQADPLKKAPKVTVIFTGRMWILREWVEQNLRVLGMLETAVEELSRLPGRRVLVLVSRGLLYAIQEHGAAQVRTRVHELIAKANRAGVTIYTLNPRGVSEANLRGGGLQDNGALMNIAEETGGRAIFNRNDLAAGFEGVLEENRGYYLLGYNPGPEAAARPHKIKVRVKRPGLRVQARATAHPAGPDLRGAIGRPQLAEVLDSPLAFRDIGLGLTPLQLSPDGKTVRVTSDVDIDLTNAEREARPEGPRVVNIDVVARVKAPDGSLFYQKGKNYTLNAPGAGPSARRGIDYWFEFEANAPGFYQVDVAVRDAVSGRVGNVTRFVEVADLARGAMGTSSLFLSAATEVASIAPPAPPGGESLSAYTRRAFTAGGTLRYQCYVYNATRDETHRASSLRVQMTLKREGVAQALTPERSVTQLDDPVFVGGDIPLEGMPPGLYTLEAAITDDRTRATRTVVSHPFRITN